MNDIGKSFGECGTCEMTNGRAGQALGKQGEAQRVFCRIMSAQNFFGESSLFENKPTVPLPTANRQGTHTTCGTSFSRGPEVDAREDGRRRRPVRGEGDAANARSWREAIHDGHALRHY